jgi:hypothetical protein
MTKKIVVLYKLLEEERFIEYSSEKDNDSAWLLESVLNEFLEIKNRYPDEGVLEIIKIKTSYN